MTPSEQIDKLEYQIAELATRNESAFEDSVCPLYADSREELSRSYGAFKNLRRTYHTSSAGIETGRRLSYSCSLCDRLLAR